MQICRAAYRPQNSLAELPRIQYPMQRMKWVSPSIDMRKQRHSIIHMTAVVFCLTLHHWLPVDTMFVTMHKKLMASVHQITLNSKHIVDDATTIRHAIDSRCSVQ
mmetsp:Transcript_17285/g.38110  ORF Transcript_17285/g.38110 Transcript_17285/m.38110 type:complete len:105 (+) Transcript_17285:791-1105(+)